ncbi:hypothetical protein [Leeuwenhoekiella sp. ZYFB001]|nr:hypothetical protein [Leeuwenhoekiella sp. ZYFB001]
MSGYHDRAISAMIQAYLAREKWNELSKQDYDNGDTNTARDRREH